MEKRSNRKYAEYFPLLIEMYTVRGLSLEDISKITGIPDITIRRMLDDKGIKRKKPGGQKGVKRKR